MKLAFWRTDEVASVIEPHPIRIEVPSNADELAEEVAVRLRNPGAHVQTRSELRAQLAEVTVERDELLAALDERRPEPDPEQLGQQLKAAWFTTAFGARGLDERWTAIAETAIDAVRGLWPSPAAAGERAAGDGEHLDPGVVAVLDAEAERRLHDPERCNKYPFCTCPTKTSPGATGQRSRRAADPEEAGNLHASGDTYCSSGTPTPAERPVPAGAPPAGAGSTTATAPESPAGPSPSLAELALEVDEHLERLAIRLAVTAGTVTKATWHLMTEPYREVYRGLATQVALAGWLPPGVSRVAGDIASVAETLTFHELLVDGTCRCGWARAHYLYAGGRKEIEASSMGEIWHAEHVARQLLDSATVS